MKFAVKQLAASMGMRASFLAKTVPGEEGSSGHVHMSLWNGATNAFAAAEPADALPLVFTAAVAGVLEHLPAASLLLNPTVNSYKRLVPGWFAPINATWGLENRSCAVRAIGSARPDLWRFECRRPGADANPYLALSAIAASAARRHPKEGRPAGRPSRETRTPGRTCRSCRAPWKPRSPRSVRTRSCAGRSG